jgi:hypothetical protein
VVVSRRAIEEFARRDHPTARFQAGSRP